MRDYYTNYPRTLLWLIPGGKIVIGGEEADSRPRFEVVVEPFYLSKFPVTNLQFEAFDMGFVRSPAAPGDGDPAVGVSHSGAQAYAEWYAKISRKPMRLPSEIEWEYACRAGSSCRYFFGEADAEADEYLWDCRNSRGRVRPLDRKQPNEFGLYGMLGGVWEWTSSPYLPYPLQTGSGRSTGMIRQVLRGGSYKTDRKEISCSLRRGENPESRLDDVGFRIARGLRHQ